MNRFKIFLLSSLFIFFPFGELIRFRVYNEITISPIDCITGILFLLFIFGIIKKKITLPLLGKPLGIFITSCILSLFANMYWLKPMELFGASLYLIRFIAYASIYPLVVCLNLSSKQKLLKFLLFSGGVFVVFGFLQYILYPDLGNLAYLGWDTHWYRVFSTFFDPNYTGAFFVAYFFLLFCFLLRHMKEKQKIIIYSLGLLATLIAILLTFSRSALLAFFAGLVSVAIVNKQSRKYVFYFLICIIIGIVIISYNYKATEGTKLFRILSSEARISSIQQSLTIFQKNPIFGIGFDAYRYAQHKYGYTNPTNYLTSHSNAGVENSFFLVLVTTGIIGLLCFCYLLFMMARKALEAKNIFGILGFTTLIALLTNSFFVNAFFYPSIMLWIWTIFGFIENR